jgi:hypothetical protein
MAVEIDTVVFWMMAPVFQKNILRPSSTQKVYAVYSFQTLVHTVITYHNTNASTLFSNVPVLCVMTRTI